MKKIKEIFFTITLLFVVIITHAQTTITITAGSKWQDALLNSRSGYTNTNYGTTNKMQALRWTFGGTPATYRNLIYTDVSDIPAGSTVTSAVLYFYTDPSWTGNINSSLSGSNEAYLEKVTSVWSDGTVTWNNQPSTTATGRIYVPQSSSNLDNPQVNITSLVQDWVDNPSTNNGMMFKLVTEVHYRSRIYASEDYATSAYRPKLVVTYEQPPFITTWKTDNPGTSSSTQITIPTAGSGYNYYVKWKHPVHTFINGTAGPFTGSATINFPFADTYEVTITGDFPYIYFNNGGDAKKLLTIEQWGYNPWTIMDYSFRGCSNLTIPASDAPDLTNVSSTQYMFGGASSFNQDISNWNVSNITRMEGMFHGASNFNQNLSSWNVSNVTDMSFMFYNASNFNQDIGNWDVSNVTNTSYMFRFAYSFNQNIGSWDVSNVTNMSYMFDACSDFNQNISSWDVSKTTNMFYMFGNASNFNQNLSSWDVSNVTDMAYMFYSATHFNQDISNWDVSSVMNMGYMFCLANEFNQDISSWEVGSVTNMSRMFRNAYNFNQNISDWDVGSVTNMSFLFSNATSFNQDLSNWDVSSVLNMNSMFFNASSFNQNLSNWDVSNVTDMSSMFLRNNFNPDIYSWDVSSVTDMSHMFYYATSFNQDLSNWDVSSVLNMNSMFFNASSFNQNLSNWDVSNVTAMASMFQNVRSLSQSNYDALLNGWSAQTLQSGVSFNGGGSQYCSALAARNILTGTYGWTITDAGLASGCRAAEGSLGSSQLSFYPNPAQDVLTLKLPEFEGASITIYDVSGRMVMSPQMLNDYQTDLSVRDIREKMVFLHLTTPQGTEVFKVLLDR